MTWEEIKQSNKLWLTPKEIAPALDVDPQGIRWMAHNQPNLLGYRVSANRSRTQIPRQPLIEFYEGNHDISERLDRIEKLLSMLIGGQDAVVAKNRMRMEGNDRG